MEPRRRGGRKRITPYRTDRAGRVKVTVLLPLEQVMWVDALADAERTGRAEVFARALAHAAQMQPMLV